MINLSNMQSKILFTLLCSIFMLSAYADTGKGSDNVGKILLKGKITSKENGKIENLPYASVLITDLSIGATCDNNGIFEITNIPVGIYTVKVACLGFEDYTVTLKIEKSIKDCNVILKPSNFFLDEVVITSKSSKVGASTASTISKTAMEHLQATSLSDVMSLLPGSDITNYKPDLKGVQTQSIRGASAFGTSVVMDGAPLSNNSNMQIMSSAIGGSIPGTGGVTPSTGTDLRNITTDNIESVEVIRGVASAAYGDMGGGAIIVNTKVGSQPLSIKFNTNPNIYSASVTHGVSLGLKKGFLNYGIDYAYSVDDPRQGYDTYNRNTGRVSYSNYDLFGGLLKSTTSLNFHLTKDKGEPNMDDDKDFQTSNERDLTFKLNTKGTFNINKGWIKNVSYVLQGNYTYRHSFFADQAVNADVPYSYSKTDGTVLSSIKGGHIYDINGNELTHFTDEQSNMRSWIIPATYDYSYNVYGKEINTFAQVKANFAGALGKTNHRIVVGADFKSDGNIGKGKVFDMENPPFRSVSYDFQTQRERSFKDIPFLNQWSLFAEETFRMSVLSRKINITSGVRYDHVNNFKGGIAPRINASVEIIPEMLSVRGAYGFTYKMPTLAYLYPDNAYFDMTNFNNSLSKNVPESQKFQLITSRVFSTENKELEMAKQTKYELGLDFNINKMSLSVTAYRDRCNNGYSLNNVFSSVNYIQYKVDKYPTDGSLPKLTQKSNDNYLLKYTRPGNTSAYEREGLEFDLDFGYIDVIRMQIILNGQWFHHKSWSNGLTYYNKNSKGDNMYGVYDSKKSGGIYNLSNTITNLIVSHNIPKIGFVVTLTGNVNWNYKKWTTYADDDTTPVGYITTDGEYHLFQPEWANEESERFKEFSSILVSEGSGVSPDRRIVEPAYNPVLCINMNVTKQFKDFDVSFFANNLFRSTPLQALVKNPGSYVRRNSDVFFFGLQLTARIK